MLNTNYATTAGDFFFCYGDEENGHCACASGHLTTANQSEIRKAYLVSVLHSTVVSQKAVRIKGTNVNVSKQVAELLYYIETKQVCNEFTKRLDSDVAEARQNREWMVEYMIKGFAIDEEVAAVGA